MILLRLLFNAYLWYLAKRDAGLSRVAAAIGAIGASCRDYEQGELSTFNEMLNDWADRVDVDND